MIEFFVPEILIGAWTGYITNLIALRMIFKEYGVWKFKFGGVIVKTRDLFIDNLASLVEEELICRDAMRDSLRSEAFLDAVRIFLADVSDRLFEEIAEAERIGGLGSLESAISKAIGYIEGRVAGLDAGNGQYKAARLEARYGQDRSAGLGASGFVACVVAKAADILAHELGSGDSGLSAAARGLLSRAINSDAAQDALSAFVCDAGNISVKNMLGEEFAARVRNNISGMYNNAVLVMRGNLFDRSARTLEKLSELIVDANALDRLEGHFENMTVAEMIGRDRANNVRSFVAEASQRRLGGAEAKRAYAEKIKGILAKAAATLDGARLSAMPGSGNNPNGEWVGTPPGSGNNPNGARSGPMPGNGYNPNELPPRSLSEVLIVDRRKLESFLSFAYKELSNLVSKFIDNNGKQIELLLQASIDNAIISGQSSKRTATFARRTFFKDAVSRYNIVGLLKGVAENRIGNMRKVYSPEFVVEKINNFGLSGAINSIEFDFSAKSLAKSITGWALNAIPANAIKNMPGQDKERALKLLQGFVVSKCEEGLSTGQNVYIHIEKALMSKIDEAMSANSGVFIDIIRKRVKPQMLVEAGLNTLSEALRNEKHKESMAGAARKFLISRRSAIAMAVKELICNLKSAKPINRAKKLFTASLHGIAASISGFLFTNYDAMVKGNIKAAVSGKLKKLNDAEILKVAESFLGQLKNIVILGAVIGGVVGIAAGLINTSAGFANETGGFSNLAAGFESFVAWFSGLAAGPNAGNIVAMTAVNVFLMGVIGWMTNVVALEMLFRPHRAVSVFGFKLRSVVNANKERLASFVGKFTDDTLLSKEVSSQLIESNQKALEELIKSNIARKQYGTLRAAIAGNSARMGERIARAGVGYAKANAGMLSECLLTDLRKTVLKLESQNVGTNEISAAIEYVCASAAVSNKGAMDLFGTDGFRKDLENKLQNIDDIELRSLFRMLVGSSYEKWAGSHGNDVLLRGKESVRAPVRALLSTKKNREAAIRGIMPGFLVGAGGRTGGLAPGIAKKYFDKNFDSIVSGLYDRAMKYLMANRVRLKGMIRIGARTKLGVLQSIAYAAADGDELLDLAFDDLLDNQLPLFIKSKLGEIKKAIRSTADGLLELFREQDPILVDTKQVESLLEYIFNDSGVTNEVASLISEIVFDMFEGIKMADVLQALDIDSIEKLLTLVDPHIRAVSHALSESIRIEAGDISATLVGFFEALLREPETAFDLSSVLKGYTNKDMSVLKKCAADAVCGSGLATAVVGMVGEGFYAGGAGRAREGAMAYESATVYAGVIEKMLSEICGDDEVRECLASLSTGILYDIGANIEDVLDDKLLEEVSNSVTDALLQTLKGALPDILKTMKFKEVAEKQINAMDSKQIEKMFKSFAGRYFKKLKLYGLWGGIFGLHRGLPLVSFVSAVVVRIRTLAKRKRT